MNENGLNFDSLELIEIPVTIGGKPYILREAGESSAARYKDAQLKGMKVVEGTDGSKTGVVDKINETRALLVSLCLFEKVGDTGERNVSLMDIKNWPHRIVNKLFEKAEEISQLEKEDKREELIKKITALQNKVKKIDEQDKTTLQAETDQDAQSKN